MKAKLSLKKTILVLIAALLLLAVVFRETLAIHAARGYLSYTCRHSLHARFAAENLFFENGELVIEKPRITTKKEIKEGGFHLVADRMVIRARPHWFLHQLDIAISLQNPTFDLRQATSDMRFWLKDSFQPLPFLTVNANMNIEGGVLAIHDFTPASPTEQRLYFKVEAEGGQQNRGSFVVSLDDPALQNNCIVLSLARLEKRHIALDLNLDGVEGAALLKALRNIIPGMENLQLSEGRIKGKMALTFPKEGRPVAQGDLGFYDIAFNAPDFDLQGRIEEAHLHLMENPNYKGNEEDHVVPRTIGHLEITREGSLVFEGPAQPFCAFQHLKGVVYFQTQDGARIAVEGTCRHRGETSRLQIDGDAHFASEGRGSLDLSVSLTGADNKAASAHFVTRQLGSKFKFVEINFGQIGSNAFDLIQTLFTPYLAGMHQFEMLQGTIDATALAYMRGLTITDLKVEKIAAKDLKLNFQPWDINLAIDDLSGELSVNCAAANILETLNTDLVVSNGRIQFTSFDQTLCRLHNVQTQFAIRKGVVQKSLLMGDLGGLQGSIEIDGTADDGEVIKASFEGKTLGLSNLLPQTIRQGLKTHFDEDQLTLQLTSRPSPLGWLVEGTAKIQQPLAEQEQTIAFGFDIELCSPQEWLLNLAAKETATPWQELGAAASMAAWAENVSVSGMLQGFYLHEGWCRAGSLPLEKYLPLFLLYGEEVKVTGLGDFQGSFDHQGLLMRYGLHNLDIENKAFRITLPEKLESGTDAVLPGTYRLDFSTDRWDAKLNVVDGSYLEKNSQLAFHDIKATICSDGETLLLDGLETECEGLLWKGSLEVAKKGTVLDIAIQAREIHGQLSQLQEFLAHFQGLKFLHKLPLNGHLSLGPKGAFFRLIFNPEGLEVEARADGGLTGGEFSIQKDEEGRGIAFKDLSLKFDYDHAPPNLVVSSIDGSLLVNKTGYSEERLAVGGKLHISDIPRGNGEFDVWINDQGLEKLRLKGISHLQNGQIEIAFDLPKTHFGEIRPKSLDLQLNNHGQIHALHLESQQTLAQLLPDIQFLMRSGILPSPSSWQARIKSLTDAKGELALKCEYDNQNATFTWQVAGEALEIADKKCAHFLLEGKKRDNAWAIDQLMIDDMSLAAELVRQPESWKVNFLALRVKETLLLGLEGEYPDGASAFDAKVNLMELDLGKLSELPSLSEFTSKARPGGFWRGSGQLRVEVDPLRIDTVLNGTLRSWNICGLQFQDAANISCHYISGQGLTLRHLTTAIQIDGEALAHLNIEKAAIDFAQQNLSLETIHFNLSAAHSSKVADHLQQAFPTWFNDRTKHTFVNLKQQGNLEGEFHLQTAPGVSLLKILLGEGQYRFQNREHFIHRLELSYDLKALKLLAHYQFANQAFWLQMFTDDPAFSSGHMLLSELPPDDLQEPPLKINWTQNNLEGWTIQKAEGDFCGLSMRLERDPTRPVSSDAIILRGEMAIDPVKASALISDEAKSKIEILKIGPGYVLNGNWHLLKRNSDSFLDQLHFNGRLEGNQVVFKGYVWQRLNALLNWNPGHIQLRDLKVEDPSGSFAMNTLTIERQEAGWVFEIPSIQATNFRPSLMQEEGSPSNLVGKPLLVRNLELENLTGYLYDSSSWKGKGKFYFINPPKKHLQNTIFAIPVELLTLIGLDMTALNPVSGTVFYEVRDGKVMLTKFKDVYSEGRLSKFYLSNVAKTPSYMNFDGTLNVQIRMKQYNLFFKLAELFTVNISGPISKPVYSLQRQTLNTRKK